MTGVEGLRRWADAIEAMAEPSHDPRYIHAHDIDLGEQLMFLAEGVRFLHWAADCLPDEAKPHVASAIELFTQAEQRSTWRAARQCLVNYGCDCKIPEDVLACQARPSLVTIYPDESKPLLAGIGLSIGHCWLGLSVLPDHEHFETARREAVENTRCIADLREQACGHLQAAVASI